MRPPKGKAEVYATHKGDNDEKGKDEETLLFFTESNQRLVSLLIIIYPTSLKIPFKA